MRVILTDELDVPDAMRKLKSVYPNILRLDYDNTRTRSSAPIDVAPETETKTPLELIEDFYEHQNHQPMNEEQAEYMKALIARIWREEP